MVHTFRSTINPEKYTFIYDTGKWDNGPVAPYFLYQTMRMDGSWVYPQALPIHLAGEYLISMAKEMMGNDELIESLKYKLTSEPEDAIFEFATQVVYKSGKKRFYSREFNRISSVRAKQHDKRWFEITNNMDGSPSSLMDFMLDEYNRSGLIRYVYARKLRKWLYEHATKRQRHNLDMPLPAEFIGWTQDWHENHAIDAAWDAVQIAINIYEQKRRFNDNVQRYTSNAMVSKLEN
jgi:hypothetical protein